LPLNATINYKLLMMIDDNKSLLSLFIITYFIVGGACMADFFLLTQARKYYV
jgi:hypothetical protein